MLIHQNIDEVWQMKINEGQWKNDSFLQRGRERRVRLTGNICERSFHCLKKISAT